MTANLPASSKPPIEIGELGRAALVGALTGLRSSSGMRHALGESSIINLLVLGELVADKLPFVPARTGVFPLVGRALTAGYAASTLSRRRETRLAFAAMGAAAAVAAAFGATALRKRVKDPLRCMALGLAEDAVVSVAGRWAREGTRAA